ncbi:HNH endonuclease [Pantoea vagans]|uniref:HNH endonuclease n=1 Tax=Pantoea vagans TaxID=470934 RepID=UPI00366F8D53
MTKKEICTEFEAACITGMSPTLLRWLSSYAPKYKEKRKLKIAEKHDDIYYFELDELHAFNTWLKSPWPFKPGTRPNIPDKIRREIMDEANGECAICHGHKDTCEAAHIDPVSQSHNNHPENLLWLCSNHHTSFDAGHFGPKDENKEFVSNFKQVLHRYKIFLWRTQHEISQKLLTVLVDCEGLAKQLKLAKTPSEIEAVEKIAKATLDKLPKLAPVSKSDPKYQEFKNIAEDISSLARDHENSVEKRLDKAHVIRNQYITAYGFVHCPLCSGEGRHNGSDCPVCDGNREVEKDIANRIDVSRFNLIDCPLCEGQGQYCRDDCPACGGNAQLEKRYAETIEVRDFENVICPLCEGEANYKGNDCPACHGNREMNRRHAVEIDLREYEEVDCPLCDGSGQFEGNDCPECGGNRTLESRFAAQIDTGSYDEVECPICEGRGTRNGDDCTVCNGERSIRQRDLYMIDKRDYQLVKCPHCKGTRHYQGDDCRKCGGEGEIERRFTY